jgi:antitoxin CcdA
MQTADPAASSTAKTPKRPVPAQMEREWLDRNREALESSNAYVEAHGLPLERHRLF